jgi:hypothetical protein
MGLFPGIETYKFVRRILLRLHTYIQPRLKNKIATFGGLEFRGQHSKVGEIVRE